MGFNFASNNSIRGRLSRTLQDIAPKEIQREVDREEFYKNALYGPKIYFRVEQVEINSIYTQKYLIFYTESRIIKPLFLNREQKIVLENIVRATGKGYIQEVSQEGKKSKRIVNLERCPKAPKGIKRAIEDGRAMKLS